MKKRYFAIIDPKTRRQLAVTDEDALGRVLGDQLGEFAVGTVAYLVREITPEQFREYRALPGTVAL